MSLADLTDAHVRALLDPEGCSDGDFNATIQVRPMLVARDLERDDKRRHVAEAGRRLLAEAQRIAEGLSEREVAILSGKAPAFFTDEATPLMRIGLMRRVKGPPFAEYDPTPAAALVLALRERSKLEREASSRLPDSDAACERWESEKDER